MLFVLLRNQYLLCCECLVCVLYVCTALTISGVFNGGPAQSTAILMAGGGGGACWEGSPGGAGGGATGQSSTGGNNPGGGGTQTAGGSSITQAGMAMMGGTPMDIDYGGGGGGGGGYWGGGAGSNANPGGGGGGGSGFFNASIVSSGVLTVGVGITPGDSSNPLRNGAGAGGAAGAPNAGTSGVVVISYPLSAMGYAAVGGTTSSSGTTMYHTFSSPGLYVFTPV